MKQYTSWIHEGWVMPIDDMMRMGIIMA